MKQTKFTGQEHKTSTARDVSRDGSELCLDCAVLRGVSEMTPTRELHTWDKGRRRMGLRSWVAVRPKPQVSLCSPERWGCRMGAGEPVCSHMCYFSLPSPSSLQKARWHPAQAAGQEGFLLALCRCLGLGSCGLSFQMNPTAKKPIDKRVGFY